MSRSTAALLIAIMFHLLLWLIFYFFMQASPKRIDKPQEHRIKVALKEQPTKSKKTAAVENTIKPVEKAPPMPQGKQLEKLPSKPEPKPAPKLEPKKTPAQESPVKPVKEEPKKPIEKPIKKPIPKESVPPKKIIETTAKDPEEVVKKVEEVKEPVKKSALYSKLSKKQVSKDVKVKHQQTGTHIGSDFQEAYGETFGKLSEGEKQYIIDNQEIMRRITQEQLNRLGPVNIPRNLNVNTMNIIEFYLHPNGDISGLRIVDASGHQILDDTSLQTIEYSYHRYPLPKQKTLIRYKVGYYLGGRR
jgi:outer membrane biosynthesis protein TonB